MNIKSPELKDIPVLKSLWKEAFADEDSFIDLFFETAFDKNRTFMAEVNGEISGALYWFDCECGGNPVAYIYGVATAIKFRGRGVCHKLMEYTHNHLKEKDYTCAVLVPGDQELFDFYKGMGYELCTYISEVKSDSANKAANIKVIDKNEYAMLRRKFLPVCGVVQEKETLDFLEKQVSFFAGDGVVLAGRKEGETFFGIEILGDVSDLPGIVKKHQCTKGVFRTAGEDKPFSMWIPLDKKSGVKPTYFGLAMD